MFTVMKPGDKISFTAEREDGVMTVKEITKEGLRTGQRKLICRYYLKVLVLEG
jgi:hypothetical protein